VVWALGSGLLVLVEHWLWSMGIVLWAVVWCWAQFFPSKIDFFDTPYKNFQSPNSNREKAGKLQTVPLGRVSMR
jgi:hypothetical protein